METIRPFAEPDEAQVVALWNATFGYPEPRNAPAGVLAEYHRHGHQGLLVAADGERVLGTIMAGYDGHRGWLYRLAVVPAARRRGVAKRLVTAARAHLRELGCRKVNIQLHTGNVTAHAFWRAVGFADEARISMGVDLTHDGPTLSDAGC